jgi:hypothetical protein
MDQKIIICMAMPIQRSRTHRPRKNLTVPEEPRDFNFLDLEWFNRSPIFDDRTEEIYICIGSPVQPMSTHMVDIHPQPQMLPKYSWLILPFHCPFNNLKKSDIMP